MPATALCATLLPLVGDLWFSPNPADRDAARRHCARCPLLYGCADAGIRGREHGVWGALDSGDRARYRGEPGRPNPDDDGDDAPLRPVPRRDCGTEPAFIAHRMRRESCVACETEHAARLEAGRRERLAAAHEAGGTDAGHRLHRALGETPCDDCHHAAMRRRADDKARRRAEGRTAWARRGGAPGPARAVLEPSGAAA